MRIFHVKQIEGCRVCEFVAEAWLALMRGGQWDKDSVLVSSDLQCVYAMEKGEVLGCITFRITEGEVVINIAYVRPKARGRGVYRAMHRRFAEVARQQKGKYILNICYVHNDGIQKTCEKLGYKPYLVHLKYDL